MRLPATLLHTLALAVSSLGAAGCGFVASRPAPSTEPANPAPSTRPTSTSQPENPEPCAPAPKTEPSRGPDYCPPCGRG